jgi:hypothetical protein
LEKHDVTIGEERRVSVITAPQYFREKAASIGTSTDYMLVPIRLIKRRFLTILQFDIDQYKAENSSGTDPNTIFLEEPIPGIAPIREILTITREEPLMHEVIACGILLKQKPNTTDITIPYHSNL